MKRKLALILALFAAFLATPSFCSPAVFDPDSISGPRIKELYMVIHRDPDSQILALERGKLDVLGDITRPVDVTRLAGNDEIDLSVAQGFHIFFMGFNLRKEPWNNLALRKAVAHAIPRQQIVRDLFSGYSTPISAFLPPASPYFEPNVPSYPYDPEAARSILEEAGWSWDPAGHLVPPGSDTALGSFKILGPTAQAAPTTVELARRIADALGKIGLRVELEPLDFSVMIRRLDVHDFDLFVMAWSLSRDPDNLFAFFHSSMDVEGGYNIQGLHDPEVDEVTERLRWAPDRKTAEEAVGKAQRLLSEKLPWVPIYSRYMITAVRKDWKGLVSSEVTTADNLWTLLSMEPVSGKIRPVFWALSDEPRSLNPLSSSSAYDWQVLGLIYDGLIAVDPYTMEDIPWLATDWKIETAESEEGPKTRLVFTLRKNVTWHDGSPFTAEDVKSTLLFLKENNIPRYYDSVRDIESVETPDDFTVIVTMEKTSYWYLHNIGGTPILPAHILKLAEDWKSWQPMRTPHPEKKGLTMLVGTGPFVFNEYRPGEYVKLSRYEGFWKLREENR